MKRKISHRTLITAAAVILVFAPHLTAWSQQPTLSDIAANVTKAMVSPAGYQVAVTQTIEKTVQTEATILTTAPAETGQFILTFSTLKGLTTSAAPFPQTPAVDSTAPGETQAVVTAATGSVPSVRMRFDVRKVLADLQTMDNVVIAGDQLNDRPHWKVTGMHGDGSEGLGYVLWIDAEHWYIQKFTVKLDKGDFTESQITYGLTGNVWLPSRIVHTFAADGTRVTQQFGVYLVQ